MEKLCCVFRRRALMRPESSSQIMPFERINIGIFFFKILPIFKQFC